MISPGVRDENYSRISTRVASQIMLLSALLLENIYSLEMRTLYSTTHDYYWKSIRKDLPKKRTP